jgi:hypothetical protein
MSFFIAERETTRVRTGMQGKFFEDKPHAQDYLRAKLTDYIRAFAQDYGTTKRRGGEIATKRHEKTQRKISCRRNYRRNDRSQRFQRSTALTTRPVIRGVTHPHSCNIMAYHFSPFATCHFSHVRRQISALRSQPSALKTHLPLATCHSSHIYSPIAPL